MLALVATLVQGMQKSPRAAINGVWYVTYYVPNTRCGAIIAPQLFDNMLIFCGAIIAPPCFIIFLYMSKYGNEYIFKKKARNDIGV